MGVEKKPVDTKLKREETENSTHNSKNAVQNSSKFGVRAFGYYLIYIIELLYSIFIRYSNFSFNLEIVMNDTSSVGKFALQLISLASARLLIWVAIYGLVCTYFRNKLKEFYKWFTGASILLFLISLLILVIQ